MKNLRKEIKNWKNTYEKLKEGNQKLNLSHEDVWMELLNNIF